MPNILVDENIAMAEEVFSNLGKVALIPGREITNQTLKNKDILIVRSITKVDNKLLKNSKVKFVGSATIGVDHLDLKYLKDNNIFYCNAPGSNSYSVAEYVITAILYLAVKYNFRLNNKSIGIVGVGNIGSKIADFARALGMTVLLNDPPLKELTNDKKYRQLSEVLNADILTLHVPYTNKGKYKTHHLLDFPILNNLKENTILINTSRGSVVNNSALSKILRLKNLKTVLDVWENEPNINLDLLKQVNLGTPHIAGYSLDGKINGTKSIYKHLCRFLKQDPIFNFSATNEVTKIIIFKEKETIEKSLLTIIDNIYSIKKDYASLLKMPESEENIFDTLRKNYSIRREFNNYEIKISSKFVDEIELLKKLRFKIGVE